MSARRFAPRAAVGVLMVLIVVLGWVSGLFAASWLNSALIIVLTAFVVLTLPTSRQFTRALAVALIAAFAVCFLTSSNLAAAISDGAGRATLYAAFMTAVILLREPVAQSRALASVKVFLSAQSSDRGYPAFLLGSHLLSLVLHMGSIGVIGSIVHDENAVPGPRPAALATLHGFITTTLWSPLAVAPAIVMAHLEGVDHTVVLLSGLGVAGVVLSASILHHRASRGGSKYQAVHVGRANWERRNLWGIVLPIVVIFALLQLVVATLGVSQMFAVALVLPLVVVAWVSLQSVGTIGIGNRLRSIVLRSVPSRADEILVMVLIGFLSAATSEIVETTEILESISAHVDNPALILLGCFWIVVFAAMAGLNGLVSVVILMETIPSAAQMGVPEPFFAMVFITAWGLSAACTALSPTVLLVADAFGTTSTRIAFDWNRGFAILILAGASLSIPVLALWFSSAA